MFFCKFFKGFLTKDVFLRIFSERFFVKDVFGRMCSEGCLPGPTKRGFVYLAFDGLGTFCFNAFLCFWGHAQKSPKIPGLPRKKKKKKKTSWQRPLFVV